MGEVYPYVKIPLKTPKNDLLHRFVAQKNSQKTSI